MTWLWRQHHARVAWVEHPEPWDVEDELLRSVNLPLNLHGNEDHPFAPALRQARADCRERASAPPALALRLEER